MLPNRIVSILSAEKWPCLFFCRFELLTEVLETGCGKYVDALTYHAYDAHEENSYERVKVLRALCQSYNPAIQMIQGETGTQSRSDGAGALKGGAWTPEKQAKYLARHMMADFFSDVMFASYFSCMDMIEAVRISCDMVDRKSVFA